MTICRELQRSHRSRSLTLASGKSSPRRLRSFTPIFCKAFETEFNLPRCAMRYASRYSQISQSPGMPACQSICATDQFVTH
jgi:hypothetical protein